MIYFVAGLVAGTYAGFFLAAILASGKMADLEAERATWERLARRATVMRVMAALPGWRITGRSQGERAAIRERGC